MMYTIFQVEYYLKYYYFPNDCKNKYDEIDNEFINNDTRYLYNL